MPVKHSSIWLLIFTFAFCFNGSVTIRRMGRHGLFRVPPPIPINCTSPPDQWFTQILDHFEPTDKTTWKQRYQEVEDYYKDGGPVFVMIGGEGEMEGGWMVNSAMVNYAKKYNALMFQIEHRFYGKSHPTSDLSVENLRYLSSEQALADLAYFIVAMNNKHKLPTGTKWVAFGGSYPGNLAAWVRLKYPHLVHAAVSSSAPVLAQVDFPEYVEVVEKSLATHSQQCVDAIKSANKQILKLLKTSVGRKTISEKFRLCSPIDNTNLNDVTHLLYDLAVQVLDLVQNGASFELDMLCKTMVDGPGTLVDRYAAVTVYPTKNCSDYKYENYIKEMKSVTWDASSNASFERQWIYQTCSEFGYYQTSESQSAMLGEELPLGYYLQRCRDIFGEIFTNESIYQAVNRTNIMYGGLDIPATRVVYVHGSIDPWHALGITKTRIPQSPAIYIHGTSHCANMLPPDDSDSAELIRAREEISSLIGKWIQEP